MNTLLKFAMLGIASLSLVNCGGDTAVSAETPLMLNASGKSSQQQAVVASDYHNVVQKIYVGYFGRPADPGGLAFFSGRMLDLQAPTGLAAMGAAYTANNGLRTLIDVFGNSLESAALYAGDNSIFVDALYRNLFGRTPDAEGKAYWVGLLNTGKMSRATAAINIMAGAQLTDIDVINNKVAVATYFTNALATPAQQLAYSGLEANVGIRQMLGTVTLSTDPTAFRSTVDAAIAALVKNVSPQGLYSGKLGSSSLLYTSLLLENGQYWGIYSHSPIGRFAASGIVQGTGIANVGSFTSDDIRDFNPNPYNPGTINATYVPQTSFNGTIGTPLNKVEFSSSAASSELYNYNTAAVPGELAGAWLLTDSDTRTYAMSGPIAGAVSGTGAACSFSGTITPRASGKNVFDANLAYGAGTCRMAGLSASGIAFSWLQDGGSTQQLVIAATSADRIRGTVLSANRVTAAGIAPALVITDTVLGTGLVASAGKTLSVHYSGYLYHAKAAALRSTKFDSSLERAPFSFVLGNGAVIAGWDQGVAGMKVGGKRTLVIPAALGYGASGTPDGAILPNASIVFDVELLSVK